MALPSLFRSAQPKQFSFHTRYYNAEKEELENRVKVIKSEIDAEKAQKANGSNIKGKFQRPLTGIRATQQANRNANIRLIAIVAVLFWVAYYLLFS